MGSILKRRCPHPVGTAAPTRPLPLRRRGEPRALHLPGPGGSLRRYLVPRMPVMPATATLARDTAASSKSRYREVYARLETADPEGFWAEAAREIDWVDAGREGLRSRRPASTAAGSSGAECNTCHNAVDRHVAAGRGEQAGDHLRQPGHRARSATITYARAAGRGRGARRRAAGSRRRQGRPGHPLHADDPGGGRSPCWPAPASARSIRWCSAASPRRSSRPASTMPSRRSILSASCGIEASPRRALQAAPRRGDRASPPQAARPASIFQRPQAEAAHDGRAATTTGPRPSPRRRAAGAARRCVPRRRDRPALHPLHLGHDREARRASCATTAATWSR